MVAITVQDCSPPCSKEPFPGKGSIIHSFIQWNVLNTYSVPSQILDIRNRAMNKTRYLTVRSPYCKLRIIIQSCDREPQPESKHARSIIQSHEVGGGELARTNQGHLKFRTERVSRKTMAP